METINEIRESLFLRTDHTSASGHLFFSNFFRDFLKRSNFPVEWKRIFQYPSSDQCKRIFCLVVKVFFWSELFCCQQKQSIIEIRSKQSKKEFLLASGKLIFGLVKTIFYLHFSETPASDSFFPSSGNVFSMKSFIGNGKWKLVGQWKRSFCQWKLISFVQRSFSLVETVTAISKSQFLKKDRILTNVTVFLASRNQLLQFFQRAVKPVEAVYSSTGTYLFS